MLEDHDGDVRKLKEAFGAFASGVTTICAHQDGAPIGISASSFVAVSIDPPLVSVCVQRTSTTWPTLATSPRLGVSVLGVGQSAACRQIAARDGDRFAGLELSTTDDGAVFLVGAAAWLDCSVHEIVPAGDHELVLLAVHALRTNLDIAPLVFHGSGFHALSAVGE